MGGTESVFALATSPGKSAIAVIRVTGPSSGPVLVSLSGGKLPPPRQATLARLRDSRGEPLDHALVLWFPAPASFTGEDMAELHLHGGPAVVAGVMAALTAQGLRPAEPGEFTRRAFAHGKLDLTEVEALADLVSAETAAQRRQALRQEGGALSRAAESWRTRLLEAQARLEAVIDFPEDELPLHLDAEVKSTVFDLQRELTQHLVESPSGERLRSGLVLVILGAPNVGKSSLLNTLVRRDAAIVSAEAGTTRDVIEVHLDLGGLPLTMLDTAGLRETNESVEREGIRRALQRAETADLKLAVFDAATWPQQDAATAAQLDDDTVIVVNKIDSRPGLVIEPPALALSTRTGEGLDQLLVVLTQEANKRLSSASSALLTRARHRSAIQDVVSALDRFSQQDSVDLKAEELRLAGRALARITARIDVEELLDVIFSEFCIGK
jgi:tRNA modification GTPase